jgi:hypothetical protein
MLLVRQGWQGYKRKVNTAPAMLASHTGCRLQGKGDWGDMAWNGACTWHQERIRRLR